MKKQDNGKFAVILNKNKSKMTLKYKILHFIITKLLFLLLYPYDITDNKSEKQKTKKVINNWFTIMCNNIENNIY